MTRYEAPNLRMIDEIFPTGAVAKDGRLRVNDQVWKPFIYVMIQEIFSTGAVANDRSLKVNDQE